jgi:hypothetical protein
MDAIVVTCLLGDLTWLMDLYENLKLKDRKLTLHAPFRIWLDSETLEQAYMDYVRAMKVSAALKRKGVEVEARARR